jgi:hypothetical protein
VLDQQSVLAVLINFCLIFADSYPLPILLQSQGIV